MIGDYRDTDEEALASALEVYDQLTNTLSEYSGKKPAQAPPSYGQQQQSYPSSAQQGSAYGKSGLGSLGPAPGTSAGIAPGQKPKGRKHPSSALTDWTERTARHYGVMPSRVADQPDSVGSLQGREAVLGVPTDGPVVSRVLTEIAAVCNTERLFMVHTPLRARPEFGPLA